MSDDKRELKAQWNPDVEVPVFSAREVAEHNTKADVWITIHGKVYDVTKYLLDHPGGAESLIEVAGQDATDAFEDVGHSEDAKEIMAPYLCGSLKEASSAAPRPQAVRIVRKSPVVGSIEEKPASSLLSSVGYAALVAGMGGVAMASRPLLEKLVSGQTALPLSKGPSLQSLPSVGGGEYAWLKGFVVAAALSGALGATALVKISNLASIESGFQKYPAHKKSIRKPARHSTGFLSPTVYKSMPLIKKDILPGQGLVRLTFELPTESTVLGLPIGQHVAIKAQVGDQAVTRSYTPTSNNRDLGKLVLVLRIYDDGLLTGGYLSKLNIGDNVDFRGPKGAMRYRKGYAKKIGMVAGGTGITPMYQLIRAICEDETDTTEVTLVYANRSEDDILLRDELENWARDYPKNLKVWFMLDKAPGGWKYGSGFITKDVLAEKMPQPSSDSSTKVLLCGPPGMINATKNNLEQLGWKRPGTVSKMTDDVFCF